jgi:antitoxin VapB
VVLEALEAALAKERQALRAPGLAKQLLDIGDRYTALPTQDQRSDDEILGYDEHGLPA